MIDKDKILNNLTTKVIGRDIISFETIDSSNTYAKTLSDADAKNGMIIIAEGQTCGRGRFNRKWESQKERNLTFSILLKPESALNKIGLLPLLTASAVAKAIEAVTNLEVECKWPNDILINGKKTCGILIESTSTLKINRIIVGIGLNVNQELFPDGIRLTATSLKNEFGKTIDRIILLADILNRFEDMYFRFTQNDTKEYLSDWISRCKMFGKEISVSYFEKQIHGKVLRIDSDGSLILKSEDNEIKLFSGDVTINKQL
ncbi:MAG: biotin--[acetyl-CoA-carboxylase] ligase [Bacteroidota bacterium]|nr:biotin--[acetyl-CoA-carboxylase] ligase [Bacteroidota bacterium]